MSGWTAAGHRTKAEQLIVRGNSDSQPELFYAEAQVHAILALGLVMEEQVRATVALGKYAEAQVLAAAAALTPEQTLSMGAALADLADRDAADD